MIPFSSLFVFDSFENEAPHLLSYAITSKRPLADVVRFWQRAQSKVRLLLCPPPLGPVKVGHSGTGRINNTVWLSQVHEDNIN